MHIKNPLVIVLLMCLIRVPLNDTEFLKHFEAFLKLFLHSCNFDLCKPRYHCHTCKMVDGVGVCTVCAKVCHKDHDLTYAKFGSFFCDCGAKEDGSCKASVVFLQTVSVLFLVLLIFLYCSMLPPCHWLRLLFNSIILPAIHN